MTARLLVVDDERDLVDDLKELLTARGFDVVATNDVSSAIQVCKSGHFDGMLVDIAMPPGEEMADAKTGYGRETGVELARRIRSLQPHIRIIALTVIRDSAVRVRMRNAGIERVLTKPASLGEIIEAIKSVVEG